MMAANGKSSLFRLKLNKEQERMIKQMAQIQITSLMEIYEDPDAQHGQELLEIFHLAGKTSLELHEDIADMIAEFDKVIEDPSYAGMLDNDNISMVKHILINFFEDEYRKENADYKDIFRQIFFNEDHKPNLNLN